MDQSMGTWGRERILEFQELENGWMVSEMGGQTDGYIVSRWTDGWGRMNG